MKEIKLNAIPFSNSIQSNTIILYRNQDPAGINETVTVWDSVRVGQLQVLDELGYGFFCGGPGGYYAQQGVGGVGAGYGGESVFLL